MNGTEKNQAQEPVQQPAPVTATTDLEALVHPNVNKIDVPRLTSKQMEAASNFAFKRVDNMHNYAEENIIKCHKIIDEENQVFIHNATLLKALLIQFHQKKLQNDLFVQQLTSEQVAAKKEILVLKSLIPTNNDQVLRKQIQEIKQRITTFTKKRQEIVENLDCDALATIEMLNKDQDADVNQIFKWLLLFFYKDPVANYYWPNFKREAFANDKGAEFRQRCVKIKAIDMKKDELMKTELILSVIMFNDKEIKGKVQSDPVLITEPQKTAVQDLYKIIEVIMDIYRCGLEIHSVENILLDQTTTNTRVAKDIEQFEIKIGILKERIEFQDKVFKSYEFLLRQLEIKVQSFYGRQMENQNWVYLLEFEFTGKKEEIPAVYDEEIVVATQVQGFDLHEEVHHQEAVKNRQTPIDVKFAYVDEEFRYSPTKQNQDTFLPPQQTENNVDRKEGCQTCHIF